MVLSWNEIKERAISFSKEWAGTSNEEADAKPFLVEFFHVFGISSKKVATFEHRVKKLDDKEGYIDLLWKGNILIEMKSLGKNLDKAYQQARDYLHGLKDYELPKYIMVSDFDRIRLYDLVEESMVEFKLNELINNISHFGFIAGYVKHVYKEQDPVNIKAAELMGKLHDRLKAIGYEGHALEVYLVRLLFCLFAEDTNIFIKEQFQDYILQRTNEDGSDLAAKLQELFQVLNTPIEKRYKNLDEQLAAFVYVNGRLFEELLPMASFDTKMRLVLLECCYLDWAKISPAIFGSMFQSVMNPVERRNLGAHYTSEKNILKVIKPLFLDELWKEFGSIKASRNKIQEFHKKISRLKFLDPACGCGNFLVITYRELRLLEIEVLKVIQKGQQVTDLKALILLDVDQFYGIEYEEFPCRIAEVAMWLIDHQMNIIASNEFGNYFTRMPLKKAANITNDNALRIDWQSLLNPVNSIDIKAKHVNVFLTEEPAIEYKSVNIQAKSHKVFRGMQPQQTTEGAIKFDYIYGNPPFIGSKLMTIGHRADLLREAGNIQGSGVLDYVTAWYFKAAKYIQNTKIKVAFVSTNSIVQGEQTSILWGQLLNKYNIIIHFAHRTFKWSNEAKGNAAVYCIIVGFANYEITNKRIYEYEDIRGEAHEIAAKNINPYLVDAKNILVTKRSTPLCNVPNMISGNVSYDSGNLIFSEEEMNEFVLKEPMSKKWFKKLIGGKELINNQIRYCLWLVEALPEELRKMKHVLDRMELVKKARLAALDIGTHKLSIRPHQFRDLNNPKYYIAIPKTSSENREYIPINWFTEEYIPSDSIRFVETNNLYYFGVLTSKMHIAWVKSVCGRLKSDFRYSKDIVYNNFPWPLNPTDKQINAIEQAAQKVIDTRAEFPNSSLADLYDSLTMPLALVKAHNELDKAVDRAYRAQPFESKTKRMEFLFELYEKYTTLNLSSAIINLKSKI